VGLAQAIIHDPKVLILDEPTSGLDPNQLVEIRSLIQEIGKEKTVMLSTHIMQEVEAICNRVIIINQGKIVADKEEKDMLSSESNLSVLKLEFSQKIEVARLISIEGISSAKSISNNTFLVAHQKDIDVRKAIFKFAVDTDNSVLTIQKEERKLEDVFKELTGNR